MLNRNNPIRVILRIAFFLDRPDNLPASNYLVIYSAIASLLASAWLEIPYADSGSYGLSALQTLVYGLVIWIVLRLAKKPNRWRQTVTALYGTSCLVRCIAYVPMLIAVNQVTAENPYYGLAAVALPFGIWSLAITTNVIRQALEISKVVGFFIALAVTFVVSLVVIQVWGYIHGPLPGLPE